jgi:hypothetical protein
MRLAEDVNAVEEIYGGIWVVDKYTESSGRAGGRVCRR